MRILLILVLLLANLMLFGANHQMFGPVPIAGLRNPAPLTRELNPSGMQVRPMAPGEYVNHPVVGPADPMVQVKQEELSAPGTAAGASAAAGTPPASAATGASAGMGAPAVAASTAVAPAASGVHAHRHRKPPHRART